MDIRKGLLILLLIISVSAEGNETITKGQTDSGYIRLKSTTMPNGTIKTTGHVPQGGVRLKTKTTATGTTTRGYIGGKYIRTKTTKKD
ncbi:MAG: hypothetical protein DRQ89_13005 [Epsilonproteobacteria bacterium]|nr:MAG: hypothetical protein DRQ89_13005 [Campylobacterota bacterium]